MFLAFLYINLRAPKWTEVFVRQSQTDYCACDNKVVPE